MYGYIYKTTDLETNKIYIGQHKSDKFDTKYYGSGIVIRNLIKKYGLNRFKCELIEECISENHLNEREIYWINKFNSLDPEVGYNIASGGAFGNSGYHKGMSGKFQSDYQKQRAREANSGSNNPFNRNPELRLKKSEDMKGNTNASGGKGMKFINKGYDKQKRVKEEDIPYWESLGWKRGKSQKIRDEQKKRYQEKYANGSYVTDGINSRFVDNSELDYYLDNNWKIGKGPKNYINRVNYRNK